MRDFLLSGHSLLEKKMNRIKRLTSSPSEDRGVWRRIKSFELLLLSVVCL